MRRLQFLPWATLFQAAFLTVLLITGFDYLLLTGQEYSPFIQQLVTSLLTPPIGILISCAVTFGIGALAVVILEQLSRSAVSVNVLWAYILCLVVLFLVKRLLPLPALLFEFGSMPLVLMILGVFWRGQYYRGGFRRR